VNETVKVVVENGILYDTEVIDSHLRSVSFFANARTFSCNTAGPKECSKHTNLVGLGGLLPRDYSMTVRSVRVEIEDTADQDLALMKSSSMDLWIGDRFYEIPVNEAMNSKGFDLGVLCQINKIERLDVNWPKTKLPRFAGRLTVKVSLLGQIVFPTIDDDGFKERQIAFYTDRLVS